MIPESFVWHVIAELVPEPPLPIAGGVEDGPRVLWWDPIIHADGHSGNTWLHYPSDEEKRVDPRLERFTDAMPQVVLGDFGFAFSASGMTDESQAAELLAIVSERLSWADKYQLGVSVFIPLLSGVRPKKRGMRTSGPARHRLRRPPEIHSNIIIPMNPTTDDYLGPIMLHVYVHVSELDNP
ncbi:hypothetical protein B0H66DRAFT_600838 [Apodospora peruviana]|uniref:Uncharacterized protein n=1 Tax=Apodospora peruviana TaxID=516989 RepID=A0AAE0IL11_9PEZI|nr:hypothetical protein B0H66DRAFT_600838 [Apodospora peruviana]